MTPPHVVRIVVAAMASIVLTTTVVGPLAYGAHSARLDRQLVRSIKAIPGIGDSDPTTTTSTTTSRPPVTQPLVPRTTVPAAPAEPTQPVATVPVVEGPSVMGTSEVNPTPPGG